MTWYAQRIWFAVQLAWRQLVYERGKLTAAIIGVMFAAVLVFMQLGFRDSLYESISLVPKKLQGDIFLVHKQTEALWRTVSFPRAQMQRALGHSGVASATPLYIGQAQWKNPTARTKRTLLLWGSEPAQSLWAIDALAPLRESLTRADTVAFDFLSRPEFGDIRGLLAKKPQVVTEINDHRVRVVGVFPMGASFAADGNAIVSAQNFLRIFPNRSSGMIDVAVLKLHKDADIPTVKRELREMLNEDIYIFSLPEIAAFEFAYWDNNAPIGFIFGFGTVMGLIVGMVIVYQILFTDVTNHLQEYATLKAMGYTQAHLKLVVFSSSLILALVGFIPGWLTAFGLYQFAQTVTFIPMPMPLSKILSVFGLILGMCCMAGLFAMRKMKHANPADMF